MQLREKFESDTVKLKMSLLKDMEFEQSAEVLESSSCRNTQKMVKREFSFFESKKLSRNSAYDHDDTMARL